VICPAKADVRHGLEAQFIVEQLGRADEAVAMDPPSRANSAFSRPGIVRKMRTCSPCFSLVWKPTMFHSVPRALSWRRWTTA
jgi:hypothetical protein